MTTGRAAAAGPTRSQRLAMRLLGLLARLPPAWLPALGRLADLCLRPFTHRRRRIAARNLALCFPELDPVRRRRLLDAAMAAAMTALGENALAWFAPRERIERLGEVRGLEHLHAALAQGRGALLLVAHQLPMELGARILAERLGRRLDTLARRHNDPWLDALIAHGRSRFIDRLLDKKDLRGLVRSLRANRIVVLIGDQDFNLHNTFVPFFGVEASTLAVTPRLARLSGAPVLPAWCHRAAPGRYVVEIEPPLVGVAAATPEAEAARFMAAVQARVRAHPEQYLWQHRRFKTRPPGELSLY